MLDRMYFRDLRLIWRFRKKQLLHEEIAYAKYAEGLRINEESSYWWSHSAYMAGRLIIASDFHHVVAYLIRLRGMMTCRFWVWWTQLWIRKDRGHYSLYNRDLLTTWMPWWERAAYYKKEMERRHIAHERDLARVNQE